MNDEYPNRIISPYSNNGWFFVFVAIVVILAPPVLVDAQEEFTPPVMGEVVGYTLQAGEFQLFPCDLNFPDLVPPLNSLFFCPSTDAVTEAMETLLFAFEWETVTFTSMTPYEEVDDVPPWIIISSNEYVEVREAEYTFQVSVSMPPTTQPTTLPSLLYTIYTCPDSSEIDEAAIEQFSETGLPVCSGEGSTSSMGFATTQEDCKLNAGNPINLSTGEKWQLEVDKPAASDLFDLELVRYYSSEATFGAAFHSENWRNNYDRSVRLELPDVGTDPEFAYVYRPDGSYRRFEKQGGLWVSSSNVHTSLQDSGNGGFTYVDKNDSVETYNNMGQLVEVRKLSSEVRTLLYDNNEKLESVTNNFGYQLVFGYINGQLDSVTDQADRVWQYDYDNSGNIRTVTFPDLSVKEYVYNEPTNTSGNDLPTALTGTIDERDLRYSTYRYDSSERAISSFRTGNFSRVDIDYDSDTTRTITKNQSTTSTVRTEEVQGVLRLTSMEGPGCVDCSSADSSYEYNLSNSNLTNVTQSGQVTAFGDYDAKGQAGCRVEGKNQADLSTEECTFDAEVSPDARRIDYLYDSRFFGRVTQEDRPSVYVPAGSASDEQQGEADLIDDVAGLKRTEYTYNAQGNLQTIIEQGAAPDGTPVSRTTSMTYTDYSQRLTSDGPRTDINDVTSWTYHECFTSGRCGQMSTMTNAVNHRTTYPAYYDHGRLKTMVDPNLVETEYTYDLRLRLTGIQETAPDGNVRLTEIDYYPNGLLEKITTPAGVALTYMYDEAQLMRSVEDNLGNRIEFDYDPSGNQAEQLYKDPDELLHRKLNLGHDLRDRLDTINSAESITTLKYDGRDNLTKSTDPNELITDYDYDILDRLIEIRDPENKAAAPTKMFYNVHDDMTQVIAPNGATTDFLYDDLGNLLSEDGPDRGFVQYTHDDAGNVLTVTDARTIVSEYTYDALNRPLTAMYPSDPSLNAVFTYDEGLYAKGHLTKITDSSGQTSYEYDPWGNVTKATFERGGQTESISYTYTDDNNIDSITYPSGRMVMYERDDLERVIAVKYGFEVAGVSLAKDITYAPYGPRKDLTFGNGRVQTRTFDLQYRLKTQSTTDVEEKTLMYDLAGNLKDLICAPSCDQVFGYDDLDRLTSATGIYGTLFYDYDESSNRTIFDDNTLISNYTIEPDSNRLDEVTGEAAVDYDYDLSGNMTQTNERGYTYSAAGRMSEAFINGSSLAQYTYNALGQRTTKTLSDGTVIQYWYGLDGSLLAETDNHGKFREYVYLDQEPLSFFTKKDATSIPDCQDKLLPSLNCGVSIGSGGNQSPGSPGYQNQFWDVHYIHNDHLGTPQRLTDEEGDVVWSASYRPFGEVMITESRPLNFNIRFPGQYYDEESSLNYNYYRYYDPAIGRYITSDPIGLAGGLNSYGYAMQNPATYYDPDGRNAIRVGWSFGTTFGSRFANPLINWSLRRWVGVGGLGFLAYNIVHGEYAEPTWDFGSPISANPRPVIPDLLPTSVLMTGGGDNIFPFPIGERDPGGSGNSDRAKECRAMCSDAHLGTGRDSEKRFRDCLRDCMADLDFCP